MILLIALLRIVPYAIAGLLAWKKGYKRLSLAMMYVIFVALANYIFDLPAEARAFLASVFAVLLLWHAADLRQRQ